MPEKKFKRFKEKTMLSQTKHIPTQIVFDFQHAAPLLNMLTASSVKASSYLTIVTILPASAGHLVFDKP
jgi:hypothetical protein